MTSTPSYLRLMAADGGRQLPGDRHARRGDDQRGLRLREEKGIDPARFEFQMLYGIRRDLQATIAGGGHQMRTYVPHGSAWFPYFYRRCASARKM